jgi:drug/metabolite transporter (DMT)-like permease
MHPERSFEHGRVTIMDAQRRSRRIGLLCLAITAVGWGLNWPVIKLILREWPPLFARGAAGLAAALGLAAVALMRRERMTVPSHAFGRLSLAAALNVFAWMGFSTIAMVWLRVAEGALLVYTMPIWATLIAWPLRGARPTFRDLAALALGLTGIGVLLAGSGFALEAGKLPGVLLALGAAVLFALGTVLGVSAIPLPPIALTAWQVGLGCAPMVVAGLLFEKPRFDAFSPAGWASMAYMTVVPMGVCYLTWFAASRRLPAAMASTGMLVVPLVGVLSAAPIVGEPIGMRVIVALMLTLGGVFLAVRKPSTSN